MMFTSFKASIQGLRFTGPSRSGFMYLSSRWLKLQCALSMHMVSELGV